MSTLSTVMCNYNHGQYIGQAIEAVVSQSRPPDEYIILDDGSTDDSVEIIQSYAAKYPVIKFIRNPRNLGLHKSLQIVCAMARGDYFYSGGADDYILPGFFEKAMAMAEKYPRAGSIVGECVIVDVKGNPLSTLTHPDWKNSLYVSPPAFLNEYLYKVTPTHSFVAAVIYRKENLMKVDGFRSELGFWCDTFAFRAIGLRDGICFVNAPCACWRIMPEGVCHSTVKDPRRELEIIGRLIRLMESPEFKSIFPSAYVRKWAAEYRTEILSRMLGKWENQWVSPMEECWDRLPDRPARAWLLKRMLCRFDRSYRSFLRSYLKRSLEHFVINSSSPPK